MNKKILVLMGGISKEKEISILSGKACVKALRKKKYKVKVLDPKGNFLLAANQDSSDIFTFKINKESGKLDPTGSKIDIPYPVCIKFLER